VIRDTNHHVGLHGLSGNSFFFFFWWLRHAFLFCDSFTRSGLERLTTAPSEPPVQTRALKYDVGDGPIDGKRYPANHPFRVEKLEKWKDLADKAAKDKEARQ